jgi:hypothetical protein
MVNLCACEAALGLATIKRAGSAENETSMTAANDLAVRRALELAGVEFIDENGGGPGPRGGLKLRLPCCDLIGVNVELLSQLSECSITFNRRQRHLRFEARCVVPARSSAHGLF